MLDYALTTWVSLEALATASPRSEKYLWARNACVKGDVQAHTPHPSVCYHSDRSASLWGNVSVGPCGLVAVLTWKWLSGRLLLWSWQHSLSPEPSPTETLEAKKILHLPLYYSLSFRLPSLCLAPVPHPQVSSHSVFSHRFLPELPPQNHSHPQSWGSGAGSMWLPVLKRALTQQSD